MERSHTSINGLATLIILVQVAVYRNSYYSVAKPMPKETNTQFIKTSCGATTYPDLCYRTLSIYATKIQTSPRLLAITALSVSLKTTQSTLTMMTKLSKSSGLSPREAAAMSDCVEQLSDSMDELQRSIGEMGSGGGKSFELRMSDVQTWVSAALTNGDTCLDGFNGNVKATLRGRIVKVEHVTSNALALVHKYAATANQIVSL